MSLAPCGHEWCTCHCYPGSQHCKMGCVYADVAPCPKCEVVADRYCPDCHGSGAVAIP